MSEFPSLIMKYLIPKGGGAFFVYKDGGNNEASVAHLREALQAAGDWGEATQEEYDNFCSAVPAIASILRNEEWIKIQDLTEDQKRAIRRFVAGETPSIEDNATPDAGESEAGATDAPVEA